MEAQFRLNKLQLLALLTLLFAASFAMAQGIVTGTISATVEDAQGAVVGNAKVTARDVATNREITGQTTDAGFFVLRGVPPGTYVVTVEAPNFRKYENKGVVVNVANETAIGRIKMEVGSGTETVTVEGTAPLVQTDPSSAGGNFTTAQAADLPIGNGFDMLALFTPGVVDSGSNGFSNSNGASLNVNGQRGRSNNFQLDGQQNNDNSVAGPAIFFGNQDAIAEVQVLTNYSAEYGRNTGSVVNYITKNGTNAFHGTAYEVYDGSWADSLGNQDKSGLFGFCVAGGPPGCTPPVIPRSVDNRFGGTIGGPIKRDKLWFFGSANLERQRVGGGNNSSGSLISPTLAGLDQLNAAFPGNPAVGVLTSIGPSSVKQGTVTISQVNCADLPMPGISCDGAGVDYMLSDGNTTAPIEFGTVGRSLNSLFNDWEGTGRVDWQVTSKDRVFGRYIFQQQANTNVTVVSAAETAGGNFVDVPSRAQQIGIDWSHTFSPVFLNQGRFSYGRTNVGFEGGGFPGCTRASLPNGCPTRVTFGDGRSLNIGLNTNLPQGRRLLLYTVQDNASYQKGKHLLKFGGDYTKEDSPNVFLPSIDGAFTFPNYNRFLQSAPSNTQMGDGSPNIPFKENDLSFYFEDEWRVRDNLSLTLGVRWEWDQQALNLIHDNSVRQQTGPNPFWDTSLPLSLTTVPALSQDLNNFSPVVGFAWTPRMGRKVFGEDQTVVRGGFRVSYDPAFYNINLNVATSTPSINLGNVNPDLNGFSCAGCLPASGSAVDARTNVLPNLPLGVNPGTRTQTQVSRNFHNPYSIQWNFGLQRSFGPHMVFEAKYVGNHGVGQFQSVNGNPALDGLIAEGFSSFIPAGLAPCTVVGAPGNVPNVGYADCDHRRVTIRQNSAYNIYHALQTRFETRSLHGLTTGVTYTFSKNIDNSSEIFSTVSGGNTISFSQSPFDVGKAERALSGIDFPHVATVYMLYEVPFHKSQQGFVGKLLGGYQINPTWRYQSGQPWSPVQSRFDGQGSAVCDTSATFSTFFSPCRPFLSNAGAPVDTVGQCTDPTCGGSGPDSFIDFNTGADIAPSAVRWIINDVNSATFFGTPFSPVRRNIVRGQSVNNASLALIKNTKFSERFSLELRAVAFNVLNRQFRGVPDPVMIDGNFSVGSSFGNNLFNASGGDSTNVTQAGVGRRRIELGAKIIF
jgi:hypothetical protein